MRDLLCKCPKCDASLAFDRKLAGRTLCCPSCKGQIVVPVPDRTFICAACKYELVSGELWGGTEECPNCKAPVEVPLKFFSFFCPRCKLSVTSFRLRNYSGHLCQSEDLQ